MRKLASIILQGRSVAFAVVALTLAGSVGLLFGNSTPVSAAAKYTVFAGGGRAGISVDAFRPGTINVNVGDTIEFTNPYEEIHTVTFLAGKPIPDLITPKPQAKGPPIIAINPLATTVAKGDKFDGSAGVNSGILAKGDKFDVTYTTGGSFQFVCIVHPFMTATINVLPVGTFVASQTQRDAEAATFLDNVYKAGDATANRLTPKVTTSGANSNYTIAFPPPGDLPYAVNRFVPAKLSVGVGDTVTWDNNVDGPPHTITFLAGTPAPMGFAVPDASGNLVIPPNIAFGTPQKTYDGTGYANSGIIQKAPGSPPSYSLTFTKAGTYNYVCLLHIDQGMAGVIEVGGGSAGGGTPSITPPQTGDAGLASGSSMTPWLLAAAGVLVFGLGGMVAVKVRLDK